MKTPDKHPQEEERLKALKSYKILDTLPEETYDNITKIASQICQTPIALVSLVDEDRQWFKSAQGLGATETPRMYAFCAHAILDVDNTLVVPDATKDERFHDNPLVTDNPNVTFYAGVPLVNEEGLPLGTLCVIDNKPKQLSKEQVETLKVLSDQVITLLELRRKKDRLETVNDELKSTNQDLEKFATTAAHDIKSPLGNISLLADLLNERMENKMDENEKEFLRMIKQSADRLGDMVEGLLAYSKSSKLEKITPTNVNLWEFREKFEQLIGNKSSFQLKWNTELSNIKVNVSALEQVLLNLVVNAIKYNDKKVPEIEIGIQEDQHFLHFYVKDNGPGIAKEDQSRIFELFEIIDKEDRYGKQGSGIGLSTVKKVVELLGGKISIHSDKNQGTRFDFSLPRMD